MLNVERTIISQYGNSSVIGQLIHNMDKYIDPRADFDTFYSFVWDVQTARGFGLDIWGRIVNVGRDLQNLAAPTLNFGFSDGLADYAPFDNAPFYDGVPATATYTLSDDAYRTLILAKAVANISATSAQTLNQLLQNLFAGRGRCYVNDLGGMAMRYTFEFSLQPFEIAIITNSGALPRPAGVSVTTLFADMATTFGFCEQNQISPQVLGTTFVLGLSTLGHTGITLSTVQPFDCGTFYES